MSAFDISPRELVDAYEGAYGGTTIGYNYIDSNPATGNMYVLRAGNVFAVNEAAAGAGDTGMSGNSAGVTTIPLASLYSSGAAVNAASNKIFAGDGTGGLYLIDGATNTATIVAGLPANTQIRTMAMDYAANQLVAWDYSSGNLLLDGATGALLQTIPTAANGAGPLQVDSSRSLAYLGGYQALYVLNLSTASIVTTVPFSSELLGAALNPAKSRLYLTDSAAHLIVFDTSTNTVVTTITLPSGAVALAVNPLSGNFYASTNFDVYEYSSSTNSLIKHFSSTTYPAITEAVSLLANPLTDTVFVGTDGGTSSSILAAIDERSSTVTAVADLFDNVTHALTLDLASGVLGGAGASYTQLFFPSSAVNGSDVLITLTGVGVVDSLTIASTPIFRTKNTQPSFTITAAENFGITSTALVPSHAFYQVGWLAGKLEGRGTQAEHRYAHLLGYHQNSGRSHHWPAYSVCVRRRRRCLHHPGRPAER